MTDHNPAENERIATQLLATHTSHPTPPRPTRTSTVDELMAMADIDTTLQALTPAARTRVLAWVNSRHASPIQPPR